MQLEYTGVLYALSFALDVVESEVNGAEEGDEMRVGWLSYCLARGLGYTNEEMTEFIAIVMVEAVKAASPGLVVFDQRFSHGRGAVLRVRIVLEHDDCAAAPVGVFVVRDKPVRALKL